MEIFLGLLAVAIVLSLLASRGRSTVREEDQPPPGPPAAGSRPGPEVSRDAGTREGDALVDGLIIGHFLTRDHYERRLAEAEEQLRDQQRELARGELSEGDGWATPETHELDAFDGFAAADNPWAEDLGEDLDGDLGGDGAGFDELDPWDARAAGSWEVDAFGLGPGLGHSGASGPDGGVDHGSDAGFDAGIDAGFDAGFDDEY